MLIVVSIIYMELENSIHTEMDKAVDVARRWVVDFAVGSVHGFVLSTMLCEMFFFFSSRRRHTRCSRDWSSDVCSSDLYWRRIPGRARYRWVDQRPVAIVADLKVGRHDLLKMRMPDYAYPARESPVHNERCTPGSGTGLRKPAGVTPTSAPRPHVRCATDGRRDLHHECQV